MMNSGGKSDNRRKAPRRFISARVSYILVGPLEGEGKTKDISDGGLCIITDRELPVGAVIEVNFELPGNEPVPIKVQARVVWQRKSDKGFLTGLEFKQ